jgi:hypothetical protein
MSLWKTLLCCDGDSDGLVSHTVKMAIQIFFNFVFKSGRVRLQLGGDLAKRFSRGGVSLSDGGHGWQAGSVSISAASSAFNLLALDGFCAPVLIKYAVSEDRTHDLRIMRPNALPTALSPPWSHGRFAHFAELISVCAAAMRPRRRAATATAATATAATATAAKRIECAVLEI